MAGLHRESVPWITQALCAQSDPEAWFPPKTGSNRVAKQICNGHLARPPCPVRTQCLIYALKYEEPWGVWGGLSEQERRRRKATVDI